MSDYPTERVPETPTTGVATEGVVEVAGLTTLAQQYLDQTRPWLRFISVVIFVSAGLMALVGLAMLAFSVFGSLVATGDGGHVPLGGSLATGIAALIYLAMACAYIAPGLYLSRYASAINRLRAHPTAAGLEDALKHQKSFWRLVGILTVLGIVLAVAAFGLALVAGVIAAMAAARR